MAAELQPPDGQISTAPPTATTVSPSPDTYPMDHPTTTTTSYPVPAKATSNPPKRQRRPSVRLGEIGGDPPFDSNPRRPSKTWRFHKDPSFAAKNSKTRPLTNLVNGGDSNFQSFLGSAENFVNFTHRKPKSSKPTKRARTNWNKFDSTTIVNEVGRGALIGSSNAFQEDNDNINEESRDFELEGSESPLLKEQTPVNSVENMGLHFWDHQRRESGVRVSESNGVLHGEINSPEQNEGYVGVREWLTGLGLGRYASIFEIHEVDDEVLPMLTLDDLKDMGINAVGSRRKIYSAILKLRK